MSKKSERELAADIVSMLKASLAVMPNVRGDDHPHNSHTYNRLAPGVIHSIDLIEGFWSLKKKTS